MRSIQTWFFIILQFIVPKLLLTNIIYRITRLEKIVLKNYLIKNFIKIYDVNIQEIKTTDLTQFKSFNAFFTRELHVNARTISKEDFLFAFILFTKVYSPIVFSESDRTLSHLIYPLRTNLNDSWEIIK